MRPTSIPTGTGALRRLALLAALFVAAGCGGGDSADGVSNGGSTEAGKDGAGGAEDRPRVSNVLLITLDTTRADAITCYGGPAGVTPNLDALAADGVLYENAHTVTPITLPSHASMLTGLYPPRHTVRVNSANALPASALTAAEVARERGLETAAFVAAVVLGSEFGIAQGFDVFDEPPPPPPGRENVQHGRRSADRIANAFRSWFYSRERDRPFLAWVHFYDPHFPYTTPSPLGGDGYLAEVSTVDFAVGELVDALRTREVLDDTLVIVVADHGESFQEHGEQTHGALIYGATMRVPLIVRLPGDPRAGERSDELVSVVDLYPTMLDALGLPAAGRVDGVSLLGERIPADRGVYMESFYGLFSFEWSALAAWLEGDLKLIRSSIVEMYDVEKDPREVAPLRSAPSAVVQRFDAAIDGVLSAPELERGAGDVAGALAAASLSGLGYTGAAPLGDAPADPFAADRPSPVRRMEAYDRLNATDDLSTVEKNEAAIAALQQILSENPRNHSAWLRLAGARLNLQRYPAAEAAARKALEIGGDRHLTLTTLAQAVDAQDRFADAVPYYRRAIELAPADAASIQRLVSILVHLDRADEAEPYAAMLEGR